MSGGGGGRRLWRRALIVFTALALGCGAAADMEEIKSAQRQILKRLAALERNDQALLSSLRSGGNVAGLDPGRVYDIAVAGSPAKGAADAPVTVVEFVDFQCPFSKSSRGLVQEVLEAFPTDVRFVVKQFPLSQLHRHARIAAKAALAAYRQGKFWEMHDVLFAHQRSLDYDAVKQHARDIGLDIERFETDMASEELEAELRADVADARKSQVTGTPTFFVNGMRVGTRSFEAFKGMIDEALTPPRARS
jgi:protein-disulfide isomerase